MRNVLVGLFWLWLLVALGVYAYRLYRRFTRPKATRNSPRSAREGSESSSPEAPETSGVGPASRLAATPVPVTGPESTASSATWATPVPHLDSGADGSVARIDSGGRSGLFAPGPTRVPPPRPAAASSDSEARPTVAEVLRGISMPCGLAPLVDADRSFDPYRVAFSTNTAPAATVGAGVGDELERLEFELAAISDTKVLATKNGQRVRVTIHPGPEAGALDGRAFNNVAPESVIVEFQT